MEAEALIKEESRRTRGILNDLDQFEKLTEAQLNWKPEADRWSIMECIEHMNTACRHYLPRIEQAVDRFVKSGKSGSHSFKPGFMGNKLAHSMRPKEDGEIPSKMKTLKKFRPSSSLNKREVFDEFRGYQQQFLKFIVESDRLDLNKIKVGSAIGSILMFKLGDCYRFNNAHHERHMLQASRVQSHPDFPKH